MTNRDRLIELIQKEVPRPKADSLVNSILSDGWIRPPCKVGDTVYRVISDKRVKQPHECKAIGFWYSADESCNAMHLVRYVNGVFDYSISVPFSNFGKTVFLTKEEAEAKLQEIKI